MRIAHDAMIPTIARRARCEWLCALRTARRVCAVRTPVRCAHSVRCAPPRSLCARRLRAPSARLARCGAHGTQTRNAKNRSVTKIRDKRPLCRSQSATLNLSHSDPLPEVEGCALRPFDLPISDGGSDRRDCALRHASARTLPFPPLRGGRKAVADWVPFRTCYDGAHESIPHTDRIPRRRRRRPWLDPHRRGVGPPLMYPRQPLLALDCTRCGSRKQAVAYDKPPRGSGFGGLGPRPQQGAALACPHCDLVNHWPRSRR